MKILWLAHRDPLNPRAGGAERTIYEVSMRLTKKGHNVALLTGGWKGCKANDNLDGITIYRYGKSLGPHLALPIFLLKNKVDIIVNDLGHAVPWVLSAIMGHRNVVFFRHLHARSLPGQVNPLLAKIITSITEGWGYSILEASSAGTPTVAYNVPGVVDTIENGINGLRVKDGDKEALAEAALEILNDPNKWWSSSVEVAAKYSWDRTAEMWDNLIHKIAEG